MSFILVFNENVLISGLISISNVSYVLLQPYVPQIRLLEEDDELHTVGGGGGGFVFLQPWQDSYETNYEYICNICLQTHKTLVNIRLHWKRHNFKLKEVPISEQWESEKDCGYTIYRCKKCPYETLDNRRSIAQHFYHAHTTPEKWTKLWLCLYCEFHVDCKYEMDKHMQVEHGALSIEH